MSPLPTRARSRWIALIAAAFAAALPGTANAATTIAQSPIAGSTQCSNLLTVDTTCVLPFGEPATANVVVTELAVGEPEPAVLIARPVDGKPGTWSSAPVLMHPARWQVRKGTGAADTIIDVRIPLKAGERLVLVDPMVAQTGSVRDFDPTDLLLSGLTDGAVFPITPVGRVVVEHDVDADGFGDDTQDLCRGVARAHCAPATARVALSGPDYVPSHQPAVWTWSITNASADPQPFVVSLFSAEAAPTVSGPSDAVCSPGPTTSVFDAWGVKPSALAGERPAGTFTYPKYPIYFNPTVPIKPGHFFCVLPALAPGATASGTIGGSGGHTSARPVTITALVPSVNSGTMLASTLQASGVFEHARTGVASPDWKAYEILQGKVSRTGRWPVSAKCGGPLKAPSCTVTAIAKAPVGGKVLGKARPVIAKPGTPLTFTVVFSKAGLKWLAAHRKSSVDLQITTAAPSETPAVTVDRSRPGLSSALKRHFTELAAKAKEKSAKR